ncbi:hypothetical protein OQA88_9542 [Cercophora sp. LCS_1]
MRYNLLTILGVLFVPIAHSFKFVLPTDLGDGVFDGAINSTTGSVTWTKISDLPADLQRRVDASEPKAGRLSVRGDNSPAARPLNKRDQTGCTNHDVPNINHLYDSFRAGCYNEINAKHIRTLSSGGYFWYGCNYNNHAYYCNPNDIKIAYDSINYSCGAGRTGWDHLDVPNFTSGVEQLGYGTCGNL